MRSLGRGVRRLRRVWTHPSNKGRRVAAVARAIWFNVRSLSGRPTTVPLGRSSRIVAARSSISSMRVAYANPPDFREIAVWRRHLRPGDLFLDVGANVGVYTILTSELGARVVAIEPDPSSVAQLRANLDLNGLETVVVLPAALGSALGTATLVSNDVFSHIGSGPDCVDVAVTTLDEVLGDDYAAGVKIDVEGFERQVLEGAGRALAEHRIGLLQLECISAGTGGEPDRAVFDILSEHGYGLFRPTDGGELVPLHGQLYKNLFAADMRTAAALRTEEVPSAEGTGA